MPVEKIEKTLGIELVDGEVCFSIGAQVHAARRHPEDFARYVPFLGAVISSPLYLGDDEKNPGKIEFVSRLPNMAAGLLVAVEISRDGDGKYNVCSMYTIKHSQIEARRQKGYLKRCK